MGAWIETAMMSQIVGQSLVAPHVGAWIETRCPTEVIGVCWSHPMWVRGLKL